MRPINTKDRITVLENRLSEEGAYVEKGGNFTSALSDEEQEIIRSYEDTVYMLKSKHAFCEDMKQQFNTLIQTLIESCPESQEQDEAISHVKQASSITMGAILRYWDKNYAERYDTRNGEKIPYKE